MNKTEIFDKIFSQNNDFNYMALYGWQNDEETVEYGYLKGYKEAGDNLVEIAHFGKQDTLIFPIMFLYRQYIEISLKFICTKEFGRIRTKQLIQKNSHYINELWGEIKDDISSLGLFSSEDFELISQIIDFFANIDDFSMKFRFPWDKNLNLSLNLQNELRINLEELKKYIDEFDTIISLTYL